MAFGGGLILNEDGTRKLNDAGEVVTNTGGCGRLSGGFCLCTADVLHLTPSGIGFPAYLLGVDEGQPVRFRFASGAQAAFNDKTFCLYQSAIGALGQIGAPSYAVWYAKLGCLDGQYEVDTSGGTSVSPGKASVFALIQLIASDIPAGGGAANIRARATITVFPEPPASGPGFYAFRDNVVQDIFTSQKYDDLGGGSIGVEPYPVVGTIEVTADQATKMLEPSGYDYSTNSIVGFRFPGVTNGFCTSATFDVTLSQNWSENNSNLIAPYFYTTAAANPPFTGGSLRLRTCVADTCQTLEDCEAAPPTPRCIAKFIATKTGGTDASPVWSDWVFDSSEKVTAPVGGRVVTQVGQPIVPVTYLEGANCKAVVYIDLGAPNPTTGECIAPIAAQYPPTLTSATHCPPPVANDCGDCLDNQCDRYAYTATYPEGGDCTSDVEYEGPFLQPSSPEDCPGVCIIEWAPHPTADRSSIKYFFVCKDAAAPAMGGSLPNCPTDYSAGG